MRLVNVLLYFSLAGLFSGYVCYGQEKSNYKCSYQLDFLRDTINMEYFKQEIYIVQVGDKITKGYNYHNFYLDSFQKASPDLYRRLFTASVQESIEEMRRTGSVSNMQNNSFVKGAFTSDLYKDYKKKEIRIVDNISIHSFVYKDELKPQNWEILDDMTTILGYHCQKAQCHYKGRDYEAWFTQEIPISEGPWMFHGLPGLITKIQDSKGHYSFELIGFQEIKEPIDTKLSKTTQNIDRKEFLKTKFGAKGNIITKADMAKVGLDSEPIIRNYGHIDLDY